MTKPMPEPTILRDAQGRPSHAVLTWDDWISLVGATGAEAFDETEEETAAEDAFAARAFAEADAEDDGFRLPLDQLKAIRAGGHVVAVLRKWRGLSQGELAARMDIGENYLTQIETGARKGRRLIPAFAQALEAPEELIKAYL